MFICCARITSIVCKWETSLNQCCVLPFVCMLFCPLSSFQRGYSVVCILPVFGGTCKLLKVFIRYSYRLCLHFIYLTLLIFCFSINSYDAACLSVLKKQTSSVTLPEVLQLCCTDCKILWVKILLCDFGPIKKKSPLEPPRCNSVEHL